MKATKRAVGRWLLELMQRQAPQSVADAKRNAETATPAFALRFEAAAFCQESQDAIAGSVRFWNEAAVSTALETWCKENLRTAEDVAVLPAEAEAAPLSTVGKHFYASFLKASDDREALRALGVMQSVDLPAFRWVARNDMRAADVLVEARWVMPPDPEGLRAEWDDETAVRRKAQALIGLYRDMAERQQDQSPGLGTFRNWAATAWLQASAMLTAAVSTNAPHLLPALKEEMEAARATHLPRRPRLFAT